MSAVYRTGPFPEAADYSKTLLQCLQSEDFQIGSVSRVQQLLGCLVERLHDAIYVLPRNVHTATNISPDEYANDLFEAIKALRQFALQLPDEQAELEALNEQLQVLKIQNKLVMDELREKI